MHHFCPGVSNPSPDGGDPVPMSTSHTIWEVYWVAGAPTWSLELPGVRNDNDVLDKTSSPWETDESTTSSGIRRRGGKSINM